MPGRDREAVGKPLCDLVGGRARDEVSFSAYLFYKHGGGGGLGDDAREDEYGECLDPPSMVRQARQMIERYGFGESLADELSGGGYLEDPTAALAGMAQVRRRLLAAGIDTPQASNVAVTCFAHVPEARGLEAVQIVLSDPHY